MSVPNTRHTRSILPPINSTNDYRSVLNQIISKFGDPSTVKYGQDEARELMTEHITDSERMNIAIHFISDFNE